jgi:hypothetical protein
LPEASSVFTWSGVVTAPTVMVAMPTSLRTQSEYGAWYMRPYTGFCCGTVCPVEQSIMSQPASLSIRVAAIRSSPLRPPGAQSVAEMRTDMGFVSGHAARQARKTSSGNFIRFSIGPPYASLRWFVSGEMKLASR